MERPSAVTRKSVCLVFTGPLLSVERLPVWYPFSCCAAINVFIEIKEVFMVGYIGGPLLFCTAIKNGGICSITEWAVPPLLAEPSSVKKGATFLGYRHVALPFRRTDVVRHITHFGPKCTCFWHTRPVCFYVLTSHPLNSVPEILTFARASRPNLLCSLTVSHSYQFFTPQSVYFILFVFTQFLLHQDTPSS